MSNRRILRDQVNQPYYNNNYSGRSFNRRDSNGRNRLGSNRSTTSTGSDSGSDEFGIRLYEFQSLVDYNNNDIRNLLNKYGITRMGRVFIPKDKRTGLNRNFAFVNFRSEEEVTNVLSILESVGRITFDHVVIKVQRSKPRDSSSAL